MNDGASREMTRQELIEAANALREKVGELVRDRIALENINGELTEKVLDAVKKYHAEIHDGRIRCEGIVKIIEAERDAALERVAALEAGVKNLAMVEDECSLSHPNGLICCLKEAGIERECDDILLPAASRRSRKGGG